MKQSLFDLILLSSVFIAIFVISCIGGYSLKNRIEEQDKIIDEQSIVNKNQKRTIKKLKKQNKKLKKFNKKIMKSKSWKITKPLRKGISLFKK